MPGVRPTHRRIGGCYASGANGLRNRDGGRTFTGDPGALLLAPHTEIIVACGTPRQLPACTRTPGLRTCCGRAPIPTLARGPRLLAAAVADAARQEQHNEDDQQYPCPQRHLRHLFRVGVATCLPLKRGFDTRVSHGRHPLRLGRGRTCPAPGAWAAVW